MKNKPSRLILKSDSEGDRDTELQREDYHDSPTLTCPMKSVTVAVGIRHTCLATLTPEPEIPRFSSVSNSLSGTPHLHQLDIQK